MEEIIAKAVKIHRDNPALEDPEIYKLLVADGVDANIAARLVDFLPFAYMRVMYADSEITFADTYRRTDENGNLLEAVKFASDPIWSELIAYAQSEIRKGIKKQDLFAVVYGNSELNAVMVCLKKGDKLSGSSFSPPIFIHPKVDAEGFKRLIASQREKYKRNKKKWWQFWR